jgi:hypothetical protein
MNIDMVTKLDGALVQEYKISPAKAQRRKARYRVSKGFLCVFAPLREKIPSLRGSQMHLSAFLAKLLERETTRLDTPAGFS